MESKNTPQQKREPSPNNPSNKNVLIIVLLIVLFLIASGIAIYALYQNYQLKKEKNSQKLTSTPTTQPTKVDTTTAISVNLGNDLEKVYLLKIFNDVTIFHTIISDFQDGTYNQQVQKLYVADRDISTASVKEVFSLSDNEAYRLSSIERLFGKHYDYFIAQTEGVDVDFLIFTKHGDLITQSVKEENELLKNWHISFDKYNSDNETIVASLFTITNDKATVEIDPTNGKVVADTFKELPSYED